MQSMKQYVRPVQPWGAQTRYTPGRGWEMLIHPRQPGERATLFGVEGLAYQGNGPTGWVPAIKACDVKPGDVRVYHFGCTERIERAETYSYPVGSRSQRTTFWTDRREDGQPAVYGQPAGQLIAVVREAAR